MHEHRKSLEYTRQGQVRAFSTMVGVMGWLVTVRRPSPPSCLSSAFSADTECGSWGIWAGEGGGNGRAHAIYMCVCALSSKVFVSCALVEDIIAPLECQRFMDSLVAYPDNLRALSLFHRFFHHNPVPSHLIPSYSIPTCCTHFPCCVLFSCFLCSVGTNHGNDPRSVSDSRRRAGRGGHEKGRHGRAQALQQQGRRSCRRLPSGEGVGALGSSQRRSGEEPSPISRVKFGPSVDANVWWSPTR